MTAMGRDRPLPAFPGLIWSGEKAVVRLSGIAAAIGQHRSFADFPFFHFSILRLICFIQAFVEAMTPLQPNSLVDSGTRRAESEDVYALKYCGSNDRRLRSALNGYKSMALHRFPAVSDEL